MLFPQPHTIKLLATLLIAIVASLTATAIERPPLALGLTYNHATEYGQHALGVKLQSRLGQHFRLEPELIYCNERKEVTTLHLNVNVHYVMPMATRLNIYPFAGVGYSHWGYVGPNANRWGVNLGAGIEYYLGRRWGALTELRLHGVKHETQTLFTLGLKYNF